MIARLILSLTVFTMLWTGTFFHDFFGATLLPVLSQISQTLSGEEVVGLRADSAIADEAAPAHEHSPWLCHSQDDPTERLAECVHIILSLFTVNQDLSPQPGNLSHTAAAAKIVGASPRLFILHRSLLI